jgi:hypothetical protein
VQCAAVVGYTLTAALNVPELTLDHCGPLVKNLPVLACVAVLWLAHAARPVRVAPHHPSRFAVLNASPFLPVRRCAVAARQGLFRERLGRVPGGPVW